MLIDIDRNRYTYVKRNRALDILQEANLAPDKFTAHRDRSFTARYLKDRQGLFNSLDFEHKMEKAADHSIAIFKRPNPSIDRGRYITLRFSFVAMDRIGMAGVQQSQAKANGKTAKPAKIELEGDLAMVSRLVGVTRDIKQLTQYVHELVDQEKQRDHVLIALGELQKQVNMMADGLHQLLRDVPGIPHPHHASS